jgi:hypothetical protein
VLLRIISGGQTGVDRGALDAALEAGISHGGFCPLGRRAEDGAVPERYLLTELSTPAYPARTARNVAEADGTLILARGREHLVHSRGSMLTIDICRRRKKPWHAADVRSSAQADRVASWIREIWAKKAARVPGWLEELEEEAVLVVNVAGPRESRSPGIQRETAEFMRMVFERLS